MIEQYSGRFLARAGATELIEGGPEPKRIIILKFANKVAFKRWYDSPEYQKILPGRLDNSTARAFVVGDVPSDCNLASFRQALFFDFFNTIHPTVPFHDRAAKLS